MEPQQRGTHRYLSIFSVEKYIQTGKKENNNYMSAKDTPPSDLQRRPGDRGETVGKCTEQTPGVVGR